MHCSSLFNYFNNSYEGDIIEYNLYFYHTIRSLLYLILLLYRSIYDKTYRTTK